MANGLYTRAIEELARGAINLATASLEVLLVQTSYTFDPDHDFIDPDVATHEIAVAGYARQPLVSPTVTRDDANDFVYLDAPDVVFTALAAGETIGGAILVLDTGDDATTLLIAFYDMTDTATNGGDVTVQWVDAASGGVLKLAQAA